MPKRPNQPPNNENPKNNPPNYSPDFKRIAESIHDLTTQVNGKREDHKREKIDKYKDETGWSRRIRKGRKNANLYSVFITIVLTSATIALFWEASRQNDLAERHFGLDSLSMQHQINEFKALNKPYLQIEDVQITQFKPGQQVKGIFVIKNLRETPVKIIDEINGVAYRIAPIDFDKSDSESLMTINEYLIKESPDTLSFTSPKPINQTEYDSVVHGRYSIYTARRWKYKDLITDSFRFYRAIIQMKPVPNRPTYFRFVYNENENMP